jgi:hypothetical protein
MLLSTPNRYGDLPSELDSIHNYYEVLVFEEIKSSITESKRDPDYIADIACVALNHLPPRYIRYTVDMAFYLSPEERQEMSDKVKKAVSDAIEFVSKSDVHQATS